MKMRFPWLGVGLVLVGVAMLLDRLGILQVGWEVGIWVLVAIIGGYKLVRGLAEGGKGAIFWGAMLAAVAGYVALSELGVLSIPTALQLPALLVTMGLAFLLVFVRQRNDWVFLVLAFFSVAIGSAIGMAELGWLETWQVRALIGMYWPVGLILLGAALLIPRPVRSAGGGES